MSQIVLIEPDQHHANIVIDVVNKLDGEVGLLHYLTAEEFYQAVDKARKIPSEEDEEAEDTNQDTSKDANAESSGEGDGDEEKTVELVLGDLRLIITDFAATKMISLDLWRKILTIFGHSAEVDDDKENESKEEQDNDLPVRLIITEYDNNGDRNLLSLLDTTVFNTLLKPLDPLLLKQNIVFALNAKDGEELVIEGIYSQETKTKIEMIKDIKLEVLTELGFRTLSSREIAIGKVARYYGAPFKAEEEGSGSVFAYCYKNTKEEGTDLYSSSFSYIGIPRKQLSAIRRGINLSKEKESFSFPDNELVDNVKGVILSRDSEIIDNVKSLVDSKFDGLEMVNVRSLAELIRLMPAGYKHEADENSDSDTEDSDGLDKIESIFETAGKVSIVFDQEMKVITSAYIETSELEDKENSKDGSEETNKEELIKILGKEISEISKEENFIVDFLTEEGVQFYEKITSNKAVDDEEIIEVRLGKDKSSYLKFLKIEKSLAEDGVETFVLQVCELSDEEQNEHVKNQIGSVGEVNLVFFDSSFSSLQSVKSIKVMIKALNQNDSIETKFISISDKPLLVYNDLVDVDCFDDHFLKPLDVFYSTRKIKMHLPQLKMKDDTDNSRLKIPLNESIKTALPISIKSISEIHVSIYYARSLDVGKTRKFLLWSEKFPDMPEILGVCRASIEIEKDKYQCEFLFFAVNEYELQYIRQWTREQYILNKSADN